MSGGLIMKFNFFIIIFFFFCIPLICQDTISPAPGQLTNSIHLKFGGNAGLIGVTYEKFIPVQDRSFISVEGVLGYHTDLFGAIIGSVLTGDSPNGIMSFPHSVLYNFRLGQSNRFLAPGYGATYLSSGNTQPYVVMPSVFYRYINPENGFSFKGGIEMPLSAGGHPVSLFFGSVGFAYVFR